jgi:hypothetical protein
MNRFFVCICFPQLVQLTEWKSAVTISAQPFQLPDLLSGQLDITWFPGFVKPRFERAVESQQHTPNLAGLTR